VGFTTRIHSLIERVKVWPAGGPRRSLNRDEELERNKQIILEALQQLRKSRCATQSKHIQRAQQLLETLLK
jgi:hypothetical protein